MAFWSWSQTSSSNATADSTINWAEGQSPSSVNDSARAMMSALAKYRDDISGAIVTAGTSTAYTVTSNSGFDTLAHLGNQVIAFSPHVINGATVTLNVDSLGAKPLRSAPGIELQSNTLFAGTPYVALFNTSDQVFYLQGSAAGTYGVPLGGGLDFWLPTAPSSAFVFPAGQAISRSTYATLFSAMGTTYGTGDGSTTFNLPDKTGRVSFMLEASATRLTSTYFGGDSTALGSVGGGESRTLVTANLPAYTPSGSISGTFPGSLNGPFTGNVGGINLYTSGATAISASFTGTAQGGTSTPIRTVQPSIGCKYILRVI